MGDKKSVNFANWAWKHGNLKWYLIMYNYPKYFLLNLGWNKISYWNRLELCELWKGNEDVIIRVIYWILSNWLNQIKFHFCGRYNSIVCFITPFMGLACSQHMGVHSSVGRALQWQCHGLPMGPDSFLLCVWLNSHYCLHFNCMNISEDHILTSE